MDSVLRPSSIAGANFHSASQRSQHSAPASASGEAQSEILNLYVKLILNYSTLTHTIFLIIGTLFPSLCYTNTNRYNSMLLVVFSHIIP